MNWNQYFTYSDGKLIHRRREACDNHAWNARYAGREAGALRPDGYLRVKVEGRAYYAQVIVYEMHNGPVPEGYDVDHRDLDRSNNRIDNLRLATRGQNKANAPRYRNNTSGAKGVTLTRAGKYQVSVGNKDRQYVGQFDALDEAKAAYLAAAQQKYGVFARLE